MTPTCVNQNQLLLAHDGVYYFYRKGHILVSDSVGQPPRELVALPLSKKQQLLSAFHLTQRLFRLLPRTAAAVDADTFVLAMEGAVYCVNAAQKTVRAEHTFCQGMSAPLGFCKVSGIAGFADGVYYGEYVQTHNPQGTGIYCRTADGVWNKVYTFPPHQILHIHGIVADAAKSRLLILTGDADGEAGIYEVRDGFQSVTPILTGGQQCRACVAYPFRDGIVYATDMPLEQNHVYYYNEVTKTKIQLYEMPGPCIFGTQKTKAGAWQIYLATSVEPDSRLKGLRYLLTYRLGPGVKQRQSVVVGMNQDMQFAELARFKKDRLPMALFQFGNTLFPNTDEDALYVCPQCVKQYHSQTLEVKD